MYLILDSAVRKSLIERAKVKESFNTSLLEHEEEKEEKNIFNNYKMVVNPTLDIFISTIRKHNLYVF
jgi:hypothetical protein